MEIYQKNLNWLIIINFLINFENMKGFATFHIPVQPHVQKFLTAKYGECYQLSQNEFLGMILIPFFSKEVKIIKKTDIRDSVKTELYPVSVSFTFFDRQGCYLSHAQLRTIGRTLDKYFREMLFNHVLIYSQTHQTGFKKCIIDFCELHQITQKEINPESLYRDFQRKKNDFVLV